jgi:hypothetical protein
VILRFQRRTLWGRPESIIVPSKKEKKEKDEKEEKEEKLGQWNATL